MNIDVFWSFEEAVNNIKALKQEYHDVLASFSIYEVKEKAEYIKTLRKEIYKLEISEWKKDKLWEFMNGDVPYSMLLSFRNGQK